MYINVYNTFNKFSITFMMLPCLSLVSMVTWRPSNRQTVRVHEFLANHSPGKSLLLAKPSTVGGACPNTGVKTLRLLPTSPFFSDCHVTAKTTQAVASLLNFLPGSVHSNLGDRDKIQTAYTDTGESWGEHRAWRFLEEARKATMSFE